VLESSDFLLFRKGYVSYSIIKHKLSTALDKKVLIEEYNSWLRRWEPKFYGTLKSWSVGGLDLVKYIHNFTSSSDNTYTKIRVKYFLD